MVSRNVSCINVTGASHITIKGLTIAHCKGFGIEAGGTVEQPGGNAQAPGRVSDLEVIGVTVHSIGGTGIDLRGVRSGVSNSVIYDIGCRGAVVHGGNATMLEPGNNWATNNTISFFAQYVGLPGPLSPSLLRQPHEPVRRFSQ